MLLHGMAFPIHLVFQHSTGSVSRYPSPEMHRMHLLSRHGPVSRPANASAGYYKQYTIASGRHSCRTHRPSLYGTFRVDVSLLYIKQLYTPPGVSRCQPPNSLHKMLIDNVSSQHTSVRLSFPFAFGSGSLTLGTDLLTKFKLRHTPRFH